MESQATVMSRLQLLCLSESVCRSQHRETMLQSWLLLTQLSGLVQEAFATGLATKPKPKNVLRTVKAAMYGGDLRAQSVAMPYVAKGCALLQDPSTNRGLAFTTFDRERHGLQGLLPPAVYDQKLLLEQTRWQFNLLEKPLDKYVFLMELQVLIQLTAFDFLCSVVVSLSRLPPNMHECQAGT